MSFLNHLFIKFFNKKIEEDQFGNEYYESKDIDCYKPKRRYVIYKGRVEPSKVPPMWHAWLHHLKDNVLDINSSFAWQQSYVPNLTGTKLAYNLAPISANVSPIYKKWQPK